MKALGRKTRNQLTSSPKPHLNNLPLEPGDNASAPNLGTSSKHVATNSWLQALSESSTIDLGGNQTKKANRPPPFLFSMDGSELDSQYLPLFKPSSSVGHIEHDSSFWEAYIKEADAHDKELLEGWNNDLDIVLIFAGLFSAVNTSFIVESISSLQANPAEETNALLRILINRIDNSTFPGASVETLLTSFTTPQSAIRVNGLFFASLSCSLFAAFGAVLGKQWLNQYDRLGNARAADARGRARQRKYDGVVRWHLRPVVESLTTLLQASLILFFIALANYMWPIDETTAMVIVIMSAVVLLFYLAGVILAALYPDAPYQTPLTNAVRSIGQFGIASYYYFKKLARHLQSRLRRKYQEIKKEHFKKDDEEENSSNADEKSSSEPPAEPPSSFVRALKKEESLVQTLNGNSVGWLLQNTTDPNTALVASNAITHLASPSLDVEILLRLESLFSSCFKDSGWNSVLLKDGDREKAMVYGRALCHIIGLSTSVNGEEGKELFLKRLQKLHRTSAVTKRISYASRAKDSELEMLDRLIHGFLQLEPSSWQSRAVPTPAKNTGGLFFGIQSWRSTQDLPHWILHLLLGHVCDLSSRGNLTREEAIPLAVFLGVFINKKPLPPIGSVSTIALLLTILLGGVVDENTKEQSALIDRSHEMYNNLTRVISLDAAVDRDTAPVYLAALQAIQTILSDARSQSYSSSPFEPSFGQTSPAPLFNYVDLITAAQRLMRRIAHDQPTHSLLKMTVQILGLVAISQGHNRFYYRGGSWTEQDIVMVLRFLTATSPEESAELIGGLRTVAFMLRETTAISPPNNPPLIAPISGLKSSQYLDILKSESSVVDVIVTSLEAPEEPQRDAAVSVLYDSTQLWFKQNDSELHRIFLEAGLSRSLLHYITNMTNSRMSRRLFILLDILAHYPSWLFQMIEDGYVTWLTSAMHGAKGPDQWVPDRAGETFLTMWSACNRKSSSTDLGEHLDVFFTQHALDMVHIYLRRSGAREHKSISRVVGPLLGYVNVALGKNLILSRDFVQLLHDLGGAIEKSSKTLARTHADILQRL